MRKFMSAVLALGLVASSAVAADNNSTSPLSPGKPAGVKQATLAGNGTLIAVGIIVAGVIAGVIASQNGPQSGFIGTVNPTGTPSTSP